MINNAIWAVGFVVIGWTTFNIGYIGTQAVIDHFSSPPSLTQTDKAPGPHTTYTDDIESFVIYDVAPKDRPAALLGAQRAMTWMESHGAIDYFPPSEGDSP
jgi:hypothetical protein